MKGKQFLMTKPADDDEYIKQLTKTPGLQYPMYISNVLMKDDVGTVKEFPVLLNQTMKAKAYTW